MIIRRPHFGGDEDLLTGDKALVNGPADAPAHPGLVAVDAGGVDETVAVPQGPVDRVFRLLLGEPEGADAKDRHGLTAVQLDRSGSQIKG